MTRVQYWVFHDGVTSINPGDRFGEIVPERGWYCWIYPEDYNLFDDWMKKNCPKSDATWGFNGGKPMFTVHISDENESKLFRDEWIKK